MTLPKLKKKMENEKYVIYAVTFDTIEIYTSLAPQNDHQNLSFVKDFTVDGKIMTRKRHKIVHSSACVI